ncbi:MAG: type II toxin-antitoxin system CcdA family antitoxin [Promethearchaeota archaeon]
MSEKQRLNLSVNKEAVQKAKEMGLNLSEITEKILIGYTFEPKESDDETLRKQYTELLKTMLPLMKKHSFKVKIQEESFMVDNFLAKMETYYLPSGIIYNSWTDEEDTDLSRYDPTKLLPPDEILANFIEELSNVATYRERLSRELELAKRIVQAISETLPD